MDQSLSKLQALINFLTFVQNDKYMFDDLELRDKRNAKLSAKIDEVTGKVMSTLEQLLTDIQNKNSVIAKI